jgi:DNA-binding response OmpR family regulator
VRHATSGELGLAELGRHLFDAVILAVVLPGRDGFSVCSSIRKRSDVPILLVAARGEESDCVLGFDLGADGYLSKPFSPRELLARVRALVRRAQGHAEPSGRLLRTGRLVLEPSAASVRIDGREVYLSASEFSLLRALAERRGRVLSREQFLALSEGSADEHFDRAIDVRVSRLRQKLGDDSKRPTLIRTVRGLGYALIDDG